MTFNEEPESFVSLCRAAARLGVPEAWLRAEARSGRVSYLRAGRRMLFNIQQTEAALLERARGEPESEASGVAAM